MLNKTTGETAQCGPYTSTPANGGNVALVMEQNRCINDYQRQGYERSAN